jgi:UDP-N-acetylmuramoyl-tripeptide--D-alanyl-D-alanine ligase
VGHAAEAIADGARRTPGWTGVAVPTAGRDQATDWLRHNVVARDVVLVKASRGAALEHLADALADPVTAGATSGDRTDEQEGGTPSR